MRILVLGDSLTFGHSIKLENTWPYLLHKNGHWVVHRGRGGSTIKKVLQELNEIEDWSKKDEQKFDFCPFDLCIVQVGIVDVTPRPFNRNLTYLLGKTDITNAILLKVSKSKFYLRYFGKPWISENVFLNEFTLLKKKIKKFAKTTFYIEIARPAHHLLYNCGDFSEVVQKYNEILKKNDEKSKFLPIYNGKKSDKYLLRDGYHLNRSGHKLIFKKIIENIAK